MVRILFATIALMTLTPLCAFAQGASPEARMTPMQAALTQPEAMEPYAVYEGGAVTHGDLTARFSEREGFRVPLRWRPGQVADDIARRIAWERLHLEEALTEGVERGWISEDRLAQERRQVVLNHLIQDALLRAEVPTEEEKQAYHQAHLDEFTTQFSFHMRHLFLPTYVEATVQEGEAPTDIAERVSGDPELARGIRLANRRPLLAESEILTIEEVDSFGAERLIAGNTVHVPMSAEARAEVRERLDEIRAGIDSEEEFIAACREHTSGTGEELGPLPDREEEFLPELLEAAHTLEPGEISDVIETKHGVQIIMVTQKQPEEPLPFEEVEEQITSAIMEERRREAIDQWVRDAVERQGGEVHRFLDGSMRDLVGTDDVLVEVGDGETLTTADVINEFNALPPTIKLRWVDNAHFFMINQLFTQHSDVLDEEANRDEIDWLQPVLEQLQLIIAAKSHLDNTLRERALDFTEEDLQAFYEEHGERFRPPTRVDYWQIRRRLDSDLGAEELEAAGQAEIASLEAALEGTDALDEFKALIPTLSHDVPPGGDIERAHRLDVPTRTLGEIFDQALTEAEIGSLVGPLRSGWSVGAIWLEDRRTHDIPPLESVRAQVEGQLGRERFAELQEQMQREDLASIGFTLVREEPAESEAP